MAIRRDTARIRTARTHLESNSHPGYPGDCAIHYDEETQCTVVDECDTVSSFVLSNGQE